jgi:hypothetical protein
VTTLNQCNRSHSLTYSSNRDSALLKLWLHCQFEFHTVMWMARALLVNGRVNTRDTCMQQWNEVMQPASTQRLSKQTSVQVQWHHTPTVLVITWLVFSVVGAVPIKRRHYIPSVNMKHSYINKSKALKFYFTDVLQVLEIIINSVAVSGVLRHLKFEFVWSYRIM